MHRLGATGSNFVASPRPHAIDAYRLGDILDRVFADIVEAGAEFSVDLSERVFGYAYRSRFRKRFETRRDIDAVAIDGAIALDDDVAQIDADTEPHPAVVGLVRVEVGEFVLDIETALYRLDDTVEDRQHAVARGIHHPPVMRGNVGSKDRPAGVERGHRRRLVATHESRIAGHIGGHNGG